MDGQIIIFSLEEQSVIYLGGSIRFFICNDGEENIPTFEILK